MANGVIYAMDCVVICIRLDWISGSQGGTGVERAAVNSNPRGFYCSHE